jgi:hypothetical protein
MSTPRKKALRKRRKAYQRNRPNAKLHYQGAVLISIPESSRVTGLGLTMSYKLANDGTLPTVLINGRRFVHYPKLMEWLDSQSAA